MLNTSTYGKASTWSRQQSVWWLFLNSALHYTSAFAGEEQLCEWLYNVKQCWRETQGSPRCFYKLISPLTVIYESSPMIHRTFTYIWHPAGVQCYACASERPKHADVCKYYWFNRINWQPFCSSAKSLNSLVRALQIWGFNQVSQRMASIFDNLIN